MKRSVSLPEIFSTSGGKYEEKEMNELIKTTFFDIKSLLTVIEAKLVNSTKESDERIKKTKAFEILNSKRLFTQFP